MLRESRLSSGMISSPEAQPTVISNVIVLLKREGCVTRIDSVASNATEVAFDSPLVRGRFAIESSPRAGADQPVLNVLYAHRYVYRVDVKKYPANSTSAGTMEHLMDTLNGLIAGVPQEP